MAWSRESRHKRGYDYRWVKLRERILKRDTYLCQPCRGAGRTTAATEVHHITAKAHGGTDDPANLVSICPPCHLEASRKQTGRREIRRVGLDGYPMPD